MDGSVPEQRILEQSVRLPATGAVTGWAALRLHGAAFFDGVARDGRTLLAVPLAIGGGSIRGGDGVTLCHASLPAEELTRRHGIRCTIPERALWDAVRDADGLVEAVVAVDMACAGEVTSLTRMREYAAARSGRTGARRLRRVLSLASEHSWSPNESRTRMVWRLACRLPAPLVNRPVFDDGGRLLGFPDLLDAEAGLVVEYDGADHRGAVCHSRDVLREDVMRRHGLEVCHVTGPDLGVPDRVAERLLAARERAFAIGADRRRWTTIPPPGWDQGPSLDERLDLRDVMAEARRTWTA